MPHLNRTALAAAAACLLAAPGTALAESPTQTATQVARAIAAEPAAPPTTGLAGIDVPHAAGSAAAARGVTVGIPASGGPAITGDTAVYAGAAAQTQVALQATAEGLRALVDIDGPAAPERYDFALGGKGIARLLPLHGGTVLALGRSGNLVAAIAPAWARDARGAAVPTHYEVRGTTLTQVVEHRGRGVAYGVTADPTVSVGATTGVILLNRTETRQVGQGGAWVVAGAVAASLAPATAGVGTIAAIAVGVALGSVGSKVIDQQLAKNQCIKLSTPWLSFGTVVKLGWYPCPA